MKVSATARYVRGSTRKARLVVEAIRGRSVEEATALLKFMPQHAAKDVAGVLKSAAANAENNLNMAADELKRSARERPLTEAEPAADRRDDAELVAEREALSKALGELPAEYQLVVHLRLVEGYPFSEVARMTGRSVGACQMQLLRAGRLLRASLREEGIRAHA